MLRVPKDAMYIDIGVYGVPKRPGFDPKQTTRRIEAFVAEAKGYVPTHLSISPEKSSSATIATLKFSYHAAV